MRHLIVQSLVPLLLLVLVACSDDNVDKELQGVKADCRTACAIAVELVCSAELSLTDVKCEARCLSLYTSVPTCQPLYATFTECIAEQPEGKWECNDNGQADVVAGLCEDEYTLLEGCLAEG
jgi:hypothetical protein